MVVLDIILLFVYLFTPTHDFHTSWMTLTFDEEEKVFVTEWRTDTEHLEAAISKYGNVEFSLNEGTEANSTLLNSYIKDNLDLKLNHKTQKLKIENKQVTFAETTIHFKNIKCKRNLKSVSMQNQLLIATFPNQKNMVQLNYKGNMHSMLFSRQKVSENLMLKGH